MVYGIEKFKKYFSDYTGQYVFIGGTACDILLDEMGSSFRATKDLDIVLLIEAIDESFVLKLWKFIEDGCYEYKQKSTGKEQFYRFSHPENPGFPAMIELFSRKPEKINLHLNSILTPLHINDSIASLSAILLNDSYYELLISGKKIVNGYSVLAIEYIMLFKIKAWLDLSKRVKSGEQIDSKTVKKHKNDIFRLLINIFPSKRIEIKDEIHEDVIQFLEEITEDKPDLKNLGIRTVSFEKLIDRIKELFVCTNSGGS